MHIWKELTESVSWVVCDGAQTDFWYDNWLDSTGHLAFGCISDAVPRSTMVSYMLTSSGDWDWGRLEHQLPRSVLKTLAAVKPSMPQCGPDVPGWRWDERRRFMLASTYKSLMSGGDSARDSK
ncbi:hypothetical protein V6N12_033062 [Hibiscus sabdariffa]|uniref:Uncharacterized protein n=1 Tax=Hibiscus sabdariffa TaxID=183260 RepID=A0ABR2BD56_9ROSI